MKIRKATLADVAACLKLSKQEGERYWSYSKFAKSIKDKHVLFFVAEENKEILGYSLGFVVPTNTDEAMVHETRVSLAARGKSIGTKLVNHITRFFFQRKVKVVYALIEEKLKPFYIGACKYTETGSWIETSRKK